MKNKGTAMVENIIAHVRHVLIFVLRIMEASYFNMRSVEPMTNVPRSTRVTQSSQERLIKGCRRGLSVETFHSGV